jgi:hypothetical protein
VLSPLPLAAQSATAAGSRLLLSLKRERVIDGSGRGDRGCRRSTLPPWDGRTTNSLCRDNCARGWFSAGPAQQKEHPVKKYLVGIGVVVLVGFGIGGYAIAHDEDAPANASTDVLSPAAYRDRIDGVCMRVGRLYEENQGEAQGAKDRRGIDPYVVLAEGLEQEIARVEALGTPPSYIAFQQRLIGLAEQQANLLRSLGNGGHGEDLGPQIEQVDTEIEALFVEQGGFEVCGQE